MSQRINCISILTAIFLISQYSWGVNSSIVISQCPGQDVNSIRQEAESFELKFLFYYVSWSSTARQALLVYDSIANLFYDNAYFAAMDCWHMQCNCSRTHPQMLQGSGAPNRWPTLIVGYGRNLKLQYNGVWSFQDVTRFINNLFQPLDRVHSSKDVKALSRQCDAIVLALCRSAYSAEYKRFVASALKWLESDHERNVRFAVAFGEEAKTMVRKDNAALPLLILIDTHNNKVNAFNLGGAWNYREIVRWVQISLKNMYRHVNGYNTPKSISLKAHNNPVLVLSVNPQVHAEHFYTKMSEHIYFKQSLKRQFEFCEKYWSEDLVQDDWSSSMRVPAELQSSMKRLPTQCTRKLVLNKSSLANYYRINKYLNTIWRYYTHNTFYDGVDQLLELNKRNRCLNHPQTNTPALKVSIAKFIRRTSHKLWLFTPTQQRQNHSLSVVLLDSIKHKDFLLQHEIPLDTQSAANVFIVDANSESVYVMQDSYTYKALVEFVSNYYNRNLPALERSSYLPSPANAQYIATYNRQLLLQVLEQQNVTNVVMLYTPTCELSAVMGQSVLQLSLLLHSNEIRFIRLDTKANTLPWELNLEVTPSLLVFPAGSQSESRIFPTHMNPNVQNIFGFILAQVQPEIQLKLVLSSCKRTRHVRRCLEFAKSLVMQHIGQYLKFWEIYKTERNLILNHLKEFNDFHIKIESSFRI